MGRLDRTYSSRARRKGEGFCPDWAFPSVHTLPELASRTLAIEAAENQVGIVSHTQGLVEATSLRLPKCLSAVSHVDFTGSMS